MELVDGSGALWIPHARGHGSLLNHAKKGPPDWPGNTSPRCNSSSSAEVPMVLSIGILPWNVGERLQ